MELITTDFMVTSFTVGALFGFAALITGNLRIKFRVDRGGVSILLFFLYAIMPSIEWEDLVNEVTYSPLIILSRDTCTGFL